MSGDPMQACAPCRAPATGATAGPPGRIGLTTLGWVSAALTGLLLTACASVPAPVLVVLPAVQPTVTSPKVRASAPLQVLPVLLVRPLALPEYLLSRRVRYLAGAARIAEWPDAYWAERVEEGMARTFLAALRARLPEWQVCARDCGTTAPDRVLAATLLRLDAQRGDRRMLAEARIALTASSAEGEGLAKTLPFTWNVKVDLPLPADSAEGQATAMRDLLVVLADAVAGEITRAPAPAPAPAPVPGPPGPQVSPGRSEP